ncbi:MAG: hypothetical protein J0H74_10000 [Chitinophagaceae bacterium]|nr:hypothetical protein [Chitinophagaceae bacterium]
MRIKQTFILLLLTICSCIGWSQTNKEINNKNYYSYFTNRGSVNWLRVNDAVPAIIDEIIKNGIPYHTISVGDLIRINDSTALVVTITFEKAGKKYGFLYESGHGIPLDANERSFLNEKIHSYTQAEYDTKGNVKFMKINPLPQNILLLKETCYWFQFDDKETKYPVSKAVALNILRQDVDDYIKSL